MSNTIETLSASLPLTANSSNKDINEVAVAYKSKKRLNEISSILQQRFGKKWKIIIFLIVLFLLGLIILIIYGM